MHRRIALVTCLAVSIGLAGDRAVALPAATGALRAECAPGICCASYTFDDATYDVFGTLVNLGTSIGSAITVDTVIVNFDAFSGTFDGTTQSVPPGLLGFESAGDFLCSASCSFVGPISNVSGSVGLPSGVAYTQDGTVTNTHSLPASTIAGCSLGAVAVYEGSFGINGFQPQATPVGSEITVPIATTFFDSATGTQVNVSVEVSFSEVSGAGETNVTAFSNAAGEISSNFAAEVRGQCIDDPGTACCLDTDCLSGPCSGCYRAAFIDVTTSATVLPPIEICTTYPDGDDDGTVDGTTVDETTLRFLHDEGGTFVDRTSLQDFDQNVICAEVDSLSFFVVVAEQQVIVDEPCPSSLDSGCVSGFGKGFLLVKDTPGKAKLVAKLVKGPALEQTDLGNPLIAGGTELSLCMYDGEGDLAGQLTVDRAGSDCDGRPCWSSVGKDPPLGKGYKYKDTAGSADGIQRVVYKGGAGGRSKAILKAKGGALPVGIPAALAGSDAAIIQLRADDGVCLTHLLSDVKRRDSDFFKAK